MPNKISNYYLGYMCECMYILFFRTFRPTHMDQLYERTISLCENICWQILVVYFFFFFWYFLVAVVIVFYDINVKMKANCRHIF